MLNICIYVCTYMYHESARTRLQIYIFMCSLLFLGLKITTSFHVSPILRCNKSDWYYLQSLPVLGFCTVKTALSHGLLTWFADIYIHLYIYIYICIYALLRETTSFCNPLDICFRRENHFVITLLIFIHLVSDSICK